MMFFFSLFFPMVQGAVLFLKRVWREGHAGCRPERGRVVQEKGKRFRAGQKAGETAGEERGKRGG